MYKQCKTALSCARQQHFQKALFSLLESQSYATITITGLCRDAGIPRNGFYRYKEGIAYLIINNSETECTTVALPKAAQVYTLSAGKIRATTMKLNGRDLVLGESNELPDLSGASVAAGTIQLAPMTCTFLVTEA